MILAVAMVLTAVSVGCAVAAFRYARRAREYALRAGIAHVIARQAAEHAARIKWPEAER